MKHIISFIIFLMLFPTFSNAEWELLDKNPQSDISNVYMDWSSPQYGVIYQVQLNSTSPKKFIKLTNDYGKSWKILDFDSLMLANNFGAYQKLIQLDYVGNNIFFTTFSKNTIVSTDRGVTWNYFKPFPTGSVILRFNKKNKAGLIANYFKSGQSGRCYLIDSSLKIIDTLPTPEELKINSLYYTYFDSNLQYFVSNDGEKNYEFGRIVKGTCTRYPQNCVLNDADFINPKEGYSYYQNNDQLKLYSTNDSGKTWINVSSFITQAYPKVVFANNKIGYFYNIVGGYNPDTLSKSVDGGLNWKNDALPDNDSLFNPIISLTFFDNNYYLLTSKSIYIDNEPMQIKELEFIWSDEGRVFPNPLTENSEFKIVFKKDFVNIKEVKLYSEIGQVIGSIKYQVAGKTIIGVLPDYIICGVYFIGFYYADNVVFSKIIIR